MLLYRCELYCHLSHSYLANIFLLYITCTRLTYIVSVVLHITYYSTCIVSVAPTISLQWSEVFDHFKGNLSKGTIVHIWKSVTNVTEVVALGYNVLVNVGYDRLSW